MDPYACLGLAFEKFLDGEIDESENHLADYRHWRRSKGFKPDTEDYPYFRSLVDKAFKASPVQSYDADEAANLLQEMINKVHLNHSR